MTKRLAEQLRAAQLETVALGERLLVLPAGGRVIALCPREDENVFWVNPEVMDPARLAEALRSSDWANLGGDRTWISPLQ